MSNPAFHPLKSEWSLSFIEMRLLLIAQQNPDYDYNAAQRAASKVAGTVSTIESLWSTLNSLPSVHQLAAHDWIVFCRSGIEPEFSSFPKGTRIEVCCNMEVASKFAYETLIAITLGELLSVETQGRSVVDVVRASRKPTKGFNSRVRIELWLNDAEECKTITTAIKQILHAQYPTIEIKESKMGTA